MNTLRKSLLLTFFSTNGATAVQFAVTVVLARLLSPEDIGVFSITAVMVSIAHLFRDFGVGAYLQQEKELTPEKVSAAFGMLLTSSWLIALAVFALSWPASAFYGQKGIQDVMQVMAIGFAVIPFGAVTHSILTREYKATEQAYVRIVGTAAYAISAISLAHAGFGYMSMAWASLINIIATALGYLPFKPEVMTWRPRFSGWKKVMHFGAGATLSNSLEAVHTAMPDMMLGKLSGPHDVGLLSRGLGTTNLLNQVIGPTLSYAVLPYLAKAHHSGQALDQHLEKARAYATGIMWPALACTGFYAQPLIAFLYGEKWLPATPIVQWGCLMLVLSTPFSFNGAAYMAIGRPLLAVLPTLASLVLRGALILWLYDGTLESFAAGLCVAAVAGYPIHAWLQHCILGVSARAFLRSQYKSFWVCVACGCVGAALAHLSKPWAAGWQLLLAGLIIPVWWLICLRMLRHPLLAEVQPLVVRFPRLAGWLQA